MVKILAIALAVALMAAGGTGWFLFKAHETIGKLEESNAQLTASLKAKTDATRGRAKTDSDVRKLPPADILRSLQ